jgi:hypothetical protein
MSASSRTVSRISIWISEQVFVYVAKMDFSGDHEIEHFRRSLAMLPAGADALKREEAMVLLGRLRDATARLRRVEAGLQELLDTELGDGAAR